MVRTLERVTIEGRPVDPLSLRRFRRSFAGSIIQPGNESYDEARRIWNGMIDRRPLLIVRPGGVDDVRASLAFAVEHDLVVSIKGGGHNVAGTAVCDGGLMIDLSRLKAIDVDVRSRLVRVKPGVLLGELDAVTVPHGLAVPLGVVTGTGVAGLALGGGIGWLMRRHGLTCDNLVAAELVTAAGNVVIASEDENPDLLGGLRGGGGNFGVVTSFQFRAWPIDPLVTAGVLIVPLRDAAAALRRYRAWAADAPDDVTTVLSLRTVLPLGTIPVALHGKRVLQIAVCHIGPAERATRDLAPLRSLPTLYDSIGRHLFTDHQRLFDASVPSGHGYYWKSEFLAGLDDATIEVLVGFADVAPQPWSYLILFQQGGAMARVDPDSSAYVGRAAPFALNINAVWQDPGASDRPRRDTAIGWARRCWEAVRPHSTGAVYVNFLGDEGAARVREAYGLVKFARLQKLKDRWDPGNALRLNQNIAPSGSAGEDPGPSTGSPFGGDAPDGR